MKYAVVLVVGLLMGLLVSSVARPAPIDAVSAAPTPQVVYVRPTPEIVYVTPTPRPWNAKRLSVYFAPGGSGASALADSLVGDLPAAWAVATRGRSAIVSVPVDSPSVDVEVIVYADDAPNWRTEGLGGRAAALSFAMIFGAPFGRERMVHTAVHELGHALGLPHVTTGCVPPHGPIMCPIAGDAETFSDDELAKMGL